MYKMMNDLLHQETNAGDAEFRREDKELVT